MTTLGTFRDVEWSPHVAAAEAASFIKTTPERGPKINIHLMHVVLRVTLKQNKAWPYLPKDFVKLVVSDSTVEMSK